jgi:periplasmic copper chaperone A
MSIPARLSVIALVAVGITGVAAPALAHVTVNPREAEKGGFSELVFRAPNERDNADTTKVQVFFPADHPIAFVSVRPTAGWQTQVARKKLAKPIESDDGKVTEAVSSITWTGHLNPGEYQDFGVSVGPLPDDTDQLVFKALQTYSNGEVVRWIQLPSGSEEPEHPAPILTLTDPASGDAADPAPTTSAVDVTATPVAQTAQVTGESNADGTARGLGAAGLALGVVAVLVAILLGRRRTS